MSKKQPKPQKHTYIVVYKPAGILGDFPDSRGRPTVRDLIPRPGKLFVAGRLDARTEGLMVLTDDGQFAHRLTHPRYGFEREYLVQVEGHPDEKTLSLLLDGVRLKDVVAKAHSVTVLESTPEHTWVKLTLKEGKKRQIRRMFAAVGHPVTKLVRVRFGPLTLDNLNPGEWRFLTPEEVQRIRKRLHERPRSRPIRNRKRITKR